MAISPPPQNISRRQWHAVMAGFLGWTLDAFDFFVVVFLFDTLAQQFHVPKALIVRTTIYTLALRPLGALIFGWLADRYGRRVPLMANVIFFSVVELLCGFAPNYTTFAILRALYGIGMGGEWGVGASLAMEMAPRRWRGVLSGVLQSGYSIGNLLAAVAARLVLPALGWRAMFWLGGLPALLALYIRSKVPESEAWHEHRVESNLHIWRTVLSRWTTVIYLLVMMALFNMLSHGTQDLYPDFLISAHHFTKDRASDIAIIYTVGMVVGAIIFGRLSDTIGRRRSILAALVLSLAVIPWWAFGGTTIALIAGSFLMQAGVQGAWGIVPAQLNELSPDAVRGLLPGLVYQLGVLIASPTNGVEFALRDRLGYQWALAGFEITVIVALALVVAFGREEKGRSFRKAEGM
ncbi:MAG: MFS transporter [Acidobacteria bacterium]|nr:MFS transporter [Acidobacteriota bacterium]